MNRMLVALFPGDDASRFFKAVIERAAATGAEVTALHVIDPVWLRYSEADWLSTRPSRADYETYMQATLLMQAEALMRGLAEEARASSGVTFTARISRGEPAVEIVRAAVSIGAGEVILSVACPCLGTIKKKSPCPVLVI